MKGMALVVAVLLAACSGSSPRAQSSLSPSALASATPTTSVTPPAPTPVGDGPLTWAAPVRVVHQPPYDPHIVQGITCPTTALCVAVDYTGGNVLTSSNPTGGSQAWTVTNVTATGFQSADNRLEAVGCSTSGLCVAIDSSGHVITTANPTGGTGLWTVTQLALTDLTGASCPTDDLCVVVDSAGNVATSTTPLGGAAAWKVIHLSGAGGLRRVSCPTVNLCVGVTYGGNVVTSTNPIGGATAWRSTHIEGPVGCAPSEIQLAPCSLNDVSCPTATFCAAVDGGGKVLVASNPLGGAAAWTPRLVDPVAYDPSISCSGSTLCVITDGSRVIASSNPAGATPLWKATTVNGVDVLHDVSCPAPSLCVAVDHVGNLVTSINPTGGAAAWKAFSVIETNSLGHIACPAIQLCVAGDSNGNVVSSTDPTGGRTAWKVTSPDHADARLSGTFCFSADRCVGAAYFVAVGKALGLADPVDVLGLSCPRTDLCVAAGYGVVLTSINGGTSWTKTDLGDHPIAGFSCPTIHLCVALDTGGSVAVSTNPTGGAAAWKWTLIDGDGRTFDRATSGISCPSDTLCVAVDNLGNIVTSTHPTGGATAWKVNAVGRYYLTAVSCPATDLCVAIDDIGDALTTTNPRGCRLETIEGGPERWRSERRVVPVCNPVRRSGLDRPGGGGHGPSGLTESVSRASVAARFGSGRRRPEVNVSRRSASDRLIVVQWRIPVTFELNRRVFDVEIRCPGRASFDVDRWAVIDRRHL
jgi:hypothetical protein